MFCFVLMLKGIKLRIRREHSSPRSPPANAVTAPPPCPPDGHRPTPLGCPTALHLPGLRATSRGTSGCPVPSAYSETRHITSPHRCSPVSFPTCRHAVCASASLREAPPQAPQMPVNRGAAGRALPRQAGPAPVRGVSPEPSRGPHVQPCVISSR